MSSLLEMLPEQQSPKCRAVMVAAAELFMAEGYAAVSMDAVARTAGVSKATLYAHFSGKEALFEAIVTHACAQMRQRADTLLASHDLPLRQALTELALHWLRFLLRPQMRALHRVMIAEAVRFPALARAFYTAGPQAMRLWLTAWMAGEQAHGRLPADTDTARAADLFLILLRGDLFLRATLALVDEAEVEQSLPGVAAQAADTFIRLHGPAPDSAEEHFP
ncbi:TetR/AcrR family transcriptional regulator [Pseudoroseomonas ludipueritiae]|uniref:TetR/AcrR family transcriptional regulator n=1 Tax=Pseudoroseomonas ludipueritiae TaxID=198093 RepID=A0ABR7R6Y7_9PROT|nr:TetR/AcrR family transcriptional regulator [Pseudoroseomonas ludipueritiae]MBC9177464.1 TetR/AcrR family transcriptional regulator [Pseudoroseomonas ludipueritiae]